MKNPITCIPLILLLLALLGLAQEAANPFVKKAAQMEPEAPPGPIFASLTEHILVPPDLLDDWLHDHPLKEDATELRAAVQGWVIEGKAMVDHTALGSGTAGRETTVSAILEKPYPTEFAPGGPGAWPWPSSFDIRNLGNDMTTGVSPVDERPALWSIVEYAEMLFSDSYQPLIERTRQPTDVFLPRFRTMRMRQDDPLANWADDPFAEPSKGGSRAALDRPHGSIFKSGFTQLAGRFDPVMEMDSSDQLTRLVFYRGAIGEKTDDRHAKANEFSRISLRMTRVSQPTFSSWMLERSPLAATLEASAATEAWRKEGKAESAGELTSMARLGMQSTLENIQEFIYPTEWEPGTDTKVIKQWTAAEKKDGKEGVSAFKKLEVTPRSGFDGAGLASAFDTRNTGVAAELLLSLDAQRLLLKCDFARVLHLSNSIHHRIKVDDEWIPNVTMPVFAANRIITEIPIELGKWILLAATSEFLKDETLDRDHCLLVFVKVE